MSILMEPTSTQYGLDFDLEFEGAQLKLQFLTAGQLATLHGEAYTAAKALVNTHWQAEDWKTRFTEHQFRDTTERYQFPWGEVTGSYFYYVVVQQAVELADIYVAAELFQKADGTKLYSTEAERRAIGTAICAKGEFMNYMFFVLRIIQPVISEL